MKSTLLTFLCALFATFGFSQIVITEIMYNPPESGQDSLEFIELYNAGNSTVDLSNYKFISGFIDTIDMGTTLDAGAFYVSGVNPVALNTVFGITADQWDDNNLNNSSETITLVDAAGAVVDEVTYDDDNGWPIEADQGGYSLSLCDVSSDNSLVSSWGLEQTGTGIMINSLEVFATPGAANDAVCTVVIDHTVLATSSNVFTPADITINIGETVRWENTGGTHNVNGTQSTYPNNPESFGNGASSNSSWTYDFTFTQAGVNEYQCDPHAGIGMFGTVTVIDPNAPSYPNYGIGEVTTINADGVADSLGVTCTITGTVHGINFRPGGLTFTLINGFSEGIGVFSLNDDFGYTVVEGDVLQLEGEITQFNGLTQITVSKLTEAGTDDLEIPTEVSTLDESTESQLVSVVGFFDAMDWVGDGSSFNLTLQGVDGIVRIDGDTDLAMMSTPPCEGTEYKITGLGGQYDEDVPYDSGYQLFPRYASDIECTSSDNDLSQEGGIVVAPNPVRNVILISTDIEIEKYVISDLLGRIVMQGSFNNSLDINALNSGAYQLTLIKGDRMHTEKIIKE